MKSMALHGLPVPRFVSRPRSKGSTGPGFNEAVDQAAALCPVSNALRGNVEISVAAVLDTAA
jgi:organic hydroperoxide reductase OsmC/OhrA